MGFNGPVRNARASRFATDDGQPEYWETMTYPDFHRMYRRKRGKEYPKTSLCKRAEGTFRVAAFAIGSLPRSPRQRSAQMIKRDPPLF